MPSKTVPAGEIVATTGPTDLTSPLSGRLDYIDILRGLACLAVILGHDFNTMPGDVGAGGWLLYGLQIGSLGVNLFLVLSGFCLYFPLVSRSDVADVRLDMANYAKRRAWRILPPYYAAFLLYVLVNAIEGRAHGQTLRQSLPHAGNVLAHLFMLHNLSADYFGSICPVFWTQALEAQLYLIFPLLVLTARPGVWRIVWATLAVSLLWQFLVFRHFGGTPPWPQNAMWYRSLPGACSEFAIGMTAAYLVSRRCPRARTIAPALGAITVILGLAYVARFGRFGPLVDQLWGIAFGCLIVVLSRIPQRTFESHWALRTLTRLGVMSYSLYLIHFLIFANLPAVASRGWTMLAVATAHLALAIAAGSLFYYLVEKRFIHWRPRALFGSRPRADGAP